MDILVVLNGLCQSVLDGLIKLVKKTRISTPIGQMGHT